MTPRDAEMKNKLNAVGIELKAGEMLYLPAGWWHHIENLGPTVMVNFWTLGCENIHVALDNDPNRSIRSDFNNCSKYEQVCLQTVNCDAEIKPQHFLLRVSVRGMRHI
mmetsp:Transcript_33038/g.52997  ORF Transcript_33038/g.52997 Transcript_33038/m.52997 type:complete len:108 (-) Transcript_33038:709-1032(-)